MTGLQLLHELEGLRAQGVDLQDVHLAIINGGDCIFAGEAHDVEDVCYLTSTADKRKYLLFEYDDMYVKLNTLI